MWQKSKNSLAEKLKKSILGTTNQDAGENQTPQETKHANSKLFAMLIEMKGAMSVRRWQAGGDFFADASGA